MRQIAVEALGQIGAASAPATAVISEQLNSGDTRLQESARQALAKIGGRQAETALVQDASRFADADLAESRRLATTHGMKSLSEYLLRLPERRADPLARRLLSERQGDSAFMGALYLARRGDIEPALPVLADNLVRRPEVEQMFTSLAWSMAHGGDEAQFRALMEGVGRYIDENRDRYTAEQQARIDALLRRNAEQKQR